MNKIQSTLRVKKYFLEVSQEVKKVTWPTRKQTISKTALVLGISTVAALYIGGLDYMFQEAMSTLFTR